MASTKIYFMFMQGARSESTLPGMWWIETLIACEKVHRVSINMLGPHVDPKRIQSPKESLTWKQGGVCEEGREISLKGVNAGRVLLHEHPEVAELLRGHDLFVLFNPGLGNTTNLLLKLEILIMIIYYQMYQTDYLLHRP